MLRLSLNLSGSAEDAILKNCAWPLRRTLSGLSNRFKPGFMPSGRFHDNSPLHRRHIGRAFSRPVHPIVKVEKTILRRFIPHKGNQAFINLIHQPKEQPCHLTLHPWKVCLHFSSFLRAEPCPPLAWSSTLKKSGRTRLAPIHRIELGQKIL